MNEAEKSSVSGYYDAYWNRANVGTWTPEIKPWPAKEFDCKMGRFKGCERILDVGCGDGTTYQKQLAQIVGELYGLDASHLAAEAASAVGMKTKPLKIDSETFPFANDFFDGATCIEVFEHLFDPLFTAREIFRVLKPGARLVASVPNFGYFGDRLEALFRARLRTSYYDPANPFAGAHIRFFSLREFKKMLRMAGFEIEEFIPHSSCSIFDGLWFIGKFVALSCRLKEKVPYALRLGFLENIWPNVFAQHIMLVARKQSR
jgi:SAM-dependent methyltransferase